MPEEVKNDTEMHIFNHELIKMVTMALVTTKFEKQVGVMLPVTRE